MKDFQGKNKNGVLKRILYSYFGIGILGFFVVAFAWGVANFLMKMEETVKNKNIAAEKVAELEKRKEKLEKDINELSTDRGKENVFREDYGMGREGEGLVIVVPDKNIKTVSENPPSNESFSSFNNFFNRLLGSN